MSSNYNLLGDEVIEDYDSICPICFMRDMRPYFNMCWSCIENWCEDYVSLFKLAPSQWTEWRCDVDSFNSGNPKPEDYI